MALYVADDALYPARPVVMTVEEYFRWHAASPGCWNCTWNSMR
jgi:hypothetical protein